MAPAANKSLLLRSDVIAQRNADGRRIETKLLVDTKHRNLARLGHLDDRPRIAIQGSASSLVRAGFGRPR